MSASQAVFLTALFSSLSSYEPPPPPPKQANNPKTQATSTRLDISLPSNPLLSIPEASITTLKPLLTTLHLLFPNELLPALDLLDRRLVSHFFPVRNSLDDDDGNDESNVTTRTMMMGETETGPVSRPHSTSLQRHGTGDFYVVRSSASVQQKTFSPKRRIQDERPVVRSAGAASYEVRLGAWNCSCPAFVFDAVSGFTAGTADWEGNQHQDRDADQDEQRVDDLEDFVYGGWRKRGEQKKIPICKHLLACLLADRCPLLAESVEVREVTVEEIAGWCAGWGD